MVRYTDLVSDTICAQVTPSGYSGVGVVRVSGDRTLNILRSLCSFLPNEIESHRSYLGFIKDPNSKKPIDQVLVTYFSKGHSFTGDEVAEISAHGSPTILNKIVSVLLVEECRIAEKGEFSFRAFYNGKVDLVQAEAINELIHGRSLAGNEELLSNLSGKVSKEFLFVEDQILLIIAHLEAAIDFVEQDINPDDLRKIVPRIDDLLGHVDGLLGSYDVGKNLTQDQKILFYGDTNVGKSSLFNCLYGQDRAIISDMAGTTRDVIQEQAFLGSHSIRFVDTAGLRDSKEKVEILGINKTLEELSLATVVLNVIDSVSFLNSPSTELKLDDDRYIFIFNKIDQLSLDQISDLSVRLNSILPEGRDQKYFFVSAKNNEGIPDLLKTLVSRLEFENSGDYKAVVTQARQFNHLSEIAKSLKESKSLIGFEESPDIISQELQDALFQSQSLIGKTFDDEILDKVFSSFCIGK